jgi:ethanolamine utilization protein EutA
MSENGSEDGTRLTSIGIDVGTTTTQVVVSDLRVGTAGKADREKLEITDRTIRYRGAIHETPLLDPETVDVERVVAIVEDELAAAGISPEAVDTGAVIVTGETARKENAEPLAHRIASEGGEFVAATAGAALEAILAGRGSGAATRAAETGDVIANVDVGGGTTNIATFDAGGVRDTRCLDVGGRLVRFDASGAIAGVSRPVRELADDLGIDVSVGRELSDTDLERLADAMAEAVVDAIVGPPFAERTRSLAIGPLPDEPLDVDGVAFTGGVGRLVYSAADRDSGRNEDGGERDAEDDPFAYGDLGPVLAAAIRRRTGSLPVFRPEEDIRATVVGAGTRSTALSGRTVSLEETLLPLRNVPVMCVGSLAGADRSDLERRVFEVLETAAERHGRETPVVLAIDDVGSLGYDRLETVADAIDGAYRSMDADWPVLVLTRQDCAKALGGAIRRRLEGRPVLAIDEVGASDGDYLDVGTPFGGGGTVPVVVKTLAF